LSHKIKLFGEDAKAISENSTIIIHKDSVEGRDVVVLEIVN